MGWFSRKPKLEFAQVSLSEKAELFVRSTPEHFRMGVFAHFQSDIRNQSIPKLNAKAIANSMESIIVGQGAVSGKKIFQTTARDPLLTELLINRLSEIISIFQLEIANGLNSVKPLSREALELLRDLNSKSMKICKEFVEELESPSNTPSSAPHTDELVILMKLLASSNELSKQLIIQMRRTADFIDGHLND